jgi:hypothetical protein
VLHGQFPSRNRVGQAMADLFGCAPSPGALSSVTLFKSVAATLACMRHNRTRIPFSSASHAEARSSKVALRPLIATLKL